MADEPKKGDAAPLEGTLGPQIMMLLNIGFASMTLGMCNNLALAAGQSLEGPLLASDLANIAPQVSLANNATAPSLGMPGLNGPSAPAPKMGGLFG
jgi:hypothetical protein